MFLIDTPELPTEPVSTELIVENEPAAKEKVFGVCLPLSSKPPKTDYLRDQRYVVAPRGEGMIYLENYEGRPFNEADFKRTTFTWLKKPSLAELIPNPEPRMEGSFYLVPHDNNNGGRDHAEALFELDGVKVRIVYFLHWFGDNYVMEKEQAARWEQYEEWEHIYCTETDYEGSKKLSHSGWLDWPKVTVGELSGSALAETREFSVTLDTGIKGSDPFNSLTPLIRIESEARRTCHVCNGNARPPTRSISGNCRSNQSTSTGNWSRTDNGCLPSR